MLAVMFLKYKQFNGSDATSITDEMHFYATPPEPQTPEDMFSKLSALCKEVK